MPLKTSWLKHQASSSSLTELQPKEKENIIMYAENLHPPKDSLLLINNKLSMIGEMQNGNAIPVINL